MAVPRIPEKFLRFVWQNQLLSSFPLFTCDGARVVVRFPGTMTRDGGPDFTDASVRIGQVLYRGDVELHIRGSSWRAHGHSSDPHYNRVILHVVLHPCAGRPRPRTASGRAVPVLVLSPHVDPGLYTRWAEEGRMDQVPRARCGQMDHLLPSRILASRIRTLGLRRIERRVRLLGRRFHQILGETAPETPWSPPHGETLRTDAWEQLLYECLLEGMGYARNRLPSLALARSVPLPLLRSYGLDETAATQALLFGAAGLLPRVRVMRDGETRAYVRALRRRWRALHPLPGIPLQHEGDWMFFRLRPFNFPTARIAAFCFLLPSLFATHPLENLLSILRTPGASVRTRSAAVVSLFRISPDRFWSRHLHFRGARPCRGIALGRARITDLIVNGIVPVLLLYARLHADRVLRRESLALLRSLPSQRENRVTRLIKAGLIGRKTGLRHPVEQQGLLHLDAVYCSHRRCSRCPLRAGPRPESPVHLFGGTRRVRMSRRCLPARMSTCSRR